MKTKTTVTFFVIVCILLGLAWLLGGNKPQASATPSRLFPLSPDKITALSVTQAAVTVECARSGGDWAIVAPCKARANVGAVDRIVRTLGDLQRVETITAEQRRRRGLTLDDYGVGSNPRARMTVGNAHTNCTLLIGRDALEDVVYVRFAHEDNVVTTSAAILTVLPQNLDDLRDRNLMGGDISGISRLEIARPSSGFIQAARRDGQWTMQQPVKGARLDNERLKKLVRILGDARAERFITGADAAQTGIDDAQIAVRITTWNGGETGGQQLVLGREVPEHKDEVYARIADSDGVCTVKKEVWDAFNIRASDLRDSAVFPLSPADIVFVSLREGERKLEFHRAGADWLITEPRRLKTDPAVVGELLAKLCEVRAGEFIDTTEPLSVVGLDPALRSMEVSTSLPGDVDVAGATQREPAFRKVLMIGNETADHRGFNARFADEASIFLIGREPLNSVLSGTYATLPVSTGSATNSAQGGTWINPLLYCNRTMLELDRNSIVGISLFKEGREQAARRDETGSWQPVPPLAGRIKSEMVSFILNTAARLEATEIKFEGSDKPASFGLDEPVAKITFALAGDKGIRKTLLIGFPAGGDGVYAMILGQDVVFVLPMRLVGNLLRDLVPEEDHGG